MRQTFISTRASYANALVVTTNSEELKNLSKKREHYSKCFTVNEILLFMSTFLEPCDIIQFTTCSKILFMFRVFLLNERSARGVNLYKYRFEKMTSAGQHWNPYAVKESNSGEDGYISAIAISPCGKYIASSVSNGFIAVSCAITGKRIATYPTHHKPDYLVVRHRCIFFSNDSKKIIFPDQYKPHFSEITLKEDSSTDHVVYSSGRTTFKSIVFMRNGNFIATDTVDIRIFDGQTKKPIRNLTSPKGFLAHMDWLRKEVIKAQDRCPWYTKLCLFPDDIRMACLIEYEVSAPKTIKIWNTHTGECLLTLENFKHIASDMAISHDEKYLIVCSQDGWIGVWNLKKFSEKGYFNFWRKPEPIFQTWQNHFGNERIAISDDNQHIVVYHGGTNRFQLWNIENQELLCEKTISTAGTGGSIAFSSQRGVMAVGYNDGSIKKFRFADFIKNSQVSNEHSSITSQVKIV